MRKPVTSLCTLEWEWSAPNQGEIRSITQHAIRTRERQAAVFQTLMGTAPRSTERIRSTILQHNHQAAPKQSTVWPILTPPSVTDWAMRHRASSLGNAKQAITTHNNQSTHPCQPAPLSA